MGGLIAGPKKIVQRWASVADRGVVNNAQAAQPEFVTGHLIDAPAGWWETYEPHLYAWIEQRGFRRPRRQLSARIAGFFLLDAPLMRARWREPEAGRPVFEWEGLDAEELVFRVVGAEPAGSWQSATVLPDLAHVPDEVREVGAVPAEVCARILEDFGACAERLFETWSIQERPAEAYCPPHAVPYRSPARIGRNARCPCDSGAKYKRCCGLN